MTAPLTADYKAINAVSFAIAWYRPIAATAGSLGAKLWVAGQPKPYRAITRVTGGRTDDTDYPTLRIHTFIDSAANSYSAGMAEVDKTDARALQLVHNPGLDTVMPDGSVAHCDWAELTEAAHEEDYGAESVVLRFVSELKLGISLVPAP
ncbi:hypothetical protein MHPYR_180055 [uncultured Mycobacterium sp.]|uniref:Tail terminator n=1 Tax=uncultured Mycobacterium sp. TaxID=171292 RepID=A0A1Y5P511_9MYCO|nr:hypothetical protein MHPYR_180055 [uncultured Mycobacterium sp.]